MEAYFESVPVQRAAAAVASPPEPQKMKTVGAGVETERAGVETVLGAGIDRFGKANQAPLYHAEGVESDTCGIDPDSIRDNGAMGGDRAVSRKRLNYPGGGAAIAAAVPPGVSPGPGEFGKPLKRGFGPSGGSTPTMTCSGGRGSASVRGRKTGIRGRGIFKTLLLSVKKSKSAK
ncbi:unnamed protein product [Agarophyton chilense]